MRFLWYIASLLPVMLFGQSVPDAAQQPAGSRVLQIGMRYLDTPYVAHTLESEGEERLVIRTKEVDCLTFVEYTLAEAMGEPFASHLQQLRYRNGKIDGYLSRLHYTSDWIANGVRQGLLTDVTAAHSMHTLKLSIGFMSAHADRYRQLAASPELTKQMAAHEQALSGTLVHWLPEANLPADGLPWIVDGDVIALVTNVTGLDIAHLGIAAYVDGKLHLLHASSTLGRVVMSEKPLRQLLINNRSWTGIRVVRLKIPRH